MTVAVDPAAGRGVDPSTADVTSAWRPLPGHLRWFALTALVLHIPGLVVRLFNSDEASMATMGNVLAHGGRLYQDTADRKPPLVPYLYSLVFRVTGSTDIRWVRLVAIAALVATAVLLANEAKRRFHSDRLALGCGLLFLVSYVAFYPNDSQAATFELFQLLPMTASFVAAGRNRPAAAGVFLALATLCKQTAITTALPVAYLVYRQHKRAGLGQLTAGFVAPVAVAALLLGPAPFLLWTVTGNGGYLGGVGDLGDALLRGFGMTVSLAALELGVVVACAAAARWRTGSVELWLWVISGTVAVLAGFRFFGHYYLPLLPPAVLLATSAAPHLAPLVRRVLLAAVAAPAIVCTVIGFFPTGDTAHIPLAELAERVRQDVAPDETVFVWGDLPELYWASGRVPASRFVHTGFLTGNSGGRPDGSGGADDALPGAWQMLADDLARRPADVIVDTSTASIRQQEYYPLEETPLWPTVRASYRLVDSVEGVRIYRLVDAR